MPLYFQENNQPLPGDNEKRSLQKINDLLYNNGASSVTGQYTGTGSPNGSVTAPVGSIYFDLTDTDNPIMYIKTTGTGNTGWK